MNCSVVIRAYNEEKHIGRLLEGLRHQTVTDVETILVDSGSTDRTVSGCRIVRSADRAIPRRSLPLAGRSTSGWGQATREFVVVASAHVYPVYPDWLETLLRPFAADESVALTYGKQRGPEICEIFRATDFSSMVSRYKQSRVRRTAFCNNANAAIRKKIWEEKHYDETLTGLEDLAWAKWVKEQGLCHCVRG